MDGIVAFRYSRLMTVPGKGGRPRKWRSDADRVRAFRARQRGDVEPATLAAALADGDELARAIERGRRLQAELADAIESLDEARSAVQAERRRHQATQRRLDRARADLDGRIAFDDGRAEELRIVHQELDALKAENRALRAEVALALPHSQPARPNRAARRQAAKRDRRTER